MRLRSELFAKGSAGLAETPASDTLGHGLRNKADQSLVPSLRELDRGKLRRDSVRLCRPSRAGAGAARSPGERGDQEAGRAEALEPAAGDIAVYALCCCDVVSCHGQLLGAREDQSLAETSVSNCLQSTHSF